MGRSDTRYYLGSRVEAADIFHFLSERLPFKEISLQNRPLPAISRYAIVVACIAALGAIVMGAIDYRTEAKTKAMAEASRQCQEDLKAQIILLQEYSAAQKAEQSAGKARDPGLTTATDEKMKAMQAFKSRC